MSTVELPRLLTLSFNPNTSSIAVKIVIDLAEEPLAVLSEYDSIALLNDEQSAVVCAATPVNIIS
jgi:hypothetical protein